MSRLATRCVLAGGLVFALILVGPASSMVAASPLRPAIVDPAGDSLDPNADLRWIDVRQTDNATVHVTIALEEPPATCRPNPPTFEFRFVPFDSQARPTIDEEEGERLFARIAATCPSPVTFYSVLTGSWEYSLYKWDGDGWHSARIHGALHGSTFRMAMDLRNPLIGLDEPGDRFGGSLRSIRVAAVTCAGTSCPGANGGAEPPVPDQTVADRAPDSGFPPRLTVEAMEPPVRPQADTVRLKADAYTRKAEFLLTPDDARALIPAGVDLEPWLAGDGLGRLVYRSYFGREAGDTDRWAAYFFSVAVEPKTHHQDERFPAGSYLLPLRVFASEAVNTSLLEQWNMPVEPGWAFGSCCLGYSHLDPFGPDVYGNRFLYDSFALEVSAVTTSSDDKLESAWRYLVPQTGDALDAVDVLTQERSAFSGPARLTWSHDVNGGAPWMHLSGTMYSQFHPVNTPLQMSFVPLETGERSAASDREALLPVPDLADSEAVPETPPPASHQPWANRVEPVALVGSADGPDWGTVSVPAIAVTLVLFGLWKWASLGTLAAHIRAVPLFSRLDEDRLLQHPRRAALIEFVRSNPGASIADARRALGRPGGNVAYHARRLREGGLIHTVRDGGRLRLFAGPGRPDPDPYLTSAQRRILQRVERDPGIPQRRLAKAVGMSRENLHYHTKKLAAAGLLERVRDGRVRRHYLRAPPD